MKGKIITGRGLSGLARYVNKADAEHIAGSCEPRDFLRTAAALRAQRPDVRQAAIHISISMPPGQPLTPAQWAAAGDILMREMEMDGMEFQIVRHHDAGHDHCHLVACKIKSDGSLWNDSHSARRLHRACEIIEQEMALEHTLTVDEHRAARKSGTASKPISDGALRQFARTGDVPSATKNAISRRIKNEREREDRAAHRPATPSIAGLAINAAEDQRATPRPDHLETGTGTKNRSPGSLPKNLGSRAQQGFRADPIPVTAHPETGATPDRDSGADRIDENSQECWIEGAGAHAHHACPSLSGRLHNRESTGAAAAFDLYWQGRERPTFRWHSDSGQVQLLAKPSSANIAALFDLARESCMKPPLRIFGTPEFQRQCCEQARALGIDVRPESDRIATEHERAVRASAESIAADAARATEEREREQLRRAQEHCAAEDRAGAEHHQHTRKSPTMRPQP